MLLFSHDVFEMMYKKICCIFFFLLLTYDKAQDTVAYNSVYTKTYLETSQKNFKAALQTADSLFVISKSPYFKTKSLMLSASLYQQSGDLKKSIYYAEQSAGIISETDNVAWKARVYGFLASQYRILKIYSLSKKYIDKALKESSLIENPEAAATVKGMMYQEMAHYEHEKGNYKKSVQDITRAQAYFRSAKSDSDFFASNNEQLLGLNYLALNNSALAMKHYQNALALNKKLPENFLTGLIYSGLSNVYLKKNDLKNAKKYLDLSEKIAEQSGYLQLKTEVYATSKRYYSAVNDLKKLTEISGKKDSVDTALDELSSQSVDRSYAKIDVEMSETKESDHNKGIIIVLTIIVLLAFAAYFQWYRTRQKKNIEQYKNIIKNYDIAAAEQAKKIAESSETEIPVTADKNTADRTMVMTDATENLLLRKLEEFERSALFTDKNISLTVLAAQLGINTRYVSSVINKHKEMDFNNYINSLRIKYVISRLKTDSTFKKYKISTIAEEAGFSSPNKFTTVFKKINGISPSEFIKYLSEEIESEKQASP